MALLSLLDLARTQPGFPSEEAGWKLIVHTNPRLNLQELVYADLPAFEYWQSDHERPVYNCRHILSTVKLSTRTALVVGAYDVGDYAPLDLATVQPPVVLAEGYADWRATARTPLRYQLRRNSILDELALRVVIEVPARGMKLNSLERDVVGLRESGCVGPCPDYQDIEVSIALLQAIFRNPDANSSWRDRLSAVGGIYLLTDLRTHRLYVGKTDAREGFWDRWHAYAQMRTGNVLVDPAFATGALQPQQTIMSILQVVPRGSATEHRIEQLESRWMHRLQTRHVGYNSLPGKAREFES